MCFCWKAPNLIYIVDSSTLTTQLTAPERTSECVFSLDAHHSLVLRNTGQPFSTITGGHFNQKKKGTKMKKCGAKETAKGTVVYSMGVQTRRQSTTLFSPSGARVRCVSQSLCCFVHMLVHWRPAKRAEYWFWGFHYVLVSRWIRKHGVSERWGWAVCP